MQSPCTAVNESGLAAGKPASMAEIPHFSNCLAMAIFSLIEKLTPGVCSPSRGWYLEIQLFA